MGLGAAFIRQVENMKYLANPNRLPSHQNEKFPGRDFKHDLEVLRRDGTLVLDQFMPPEVLQSLKSSINQQLEHDCNFELPCLAQTKVDREKHKEIIDNKFKYSNKKLNEMGLCFNRSDIQNYQQVLESFKPSTLKISIQDNVAFYQLWLHSYLLRLIEAYMGRIPYLTEAYIRRNFPSDYKVMNHNWHRDQNHSRYLLKAFFFFTDCDIQHGPHEFVIGSHKDLTLKGKDYYEESEIDSHYPPHSPRRFVSRVKAGTVVLEDTLGLHRATVPKEGFRDLGFAIFVPAPFWRPHSQAFYTISEKVYGELSPEQQLYIPKCSLVPAKDALS